MLQENFLKCECGLVHSVSVEKIEISLCAFSCVADFLKKKKYKKVLLFCESENELENQIRESGIDV